MSGLLTKLLCAPSKYPLARGMLSYAIIWPSCSLIQEYLEHGTGLRKANWSRAARFSLFGSFFMAPVFYGWMKYSNRFFRRKSFMTAISRAAIEQVTYTPLAMAYFFFGMSVLEGKSYKLSVNEVREKLWPTYKVGVIFWPTVQTLNFYVVPERNRLVFVSLASLIFTIYLAHMKGKDEKTDFDSGSDAFLNIEPMSASLDRDNKDVESVNDTNLIVDEISSNLVNGNVPVVIATEDMGNAVEDSVIAIERNSNENQLELVSDRMEENSQLVQMVELETIFDEDRNVGMDIDYNFED